MNLKEEINKVNLDLEKELQSLQKQFEDFEADQEKRRERFLTALDTQLVDKAEQLQELDDQAREKAALKTDELIEEADRQIKSQNDTSESRSRSKSKDKDED